MCEPFLDFNNVFSLVHLKHFILLNLCMFPSPFHIIGSFLCDFKHIPNVLCTTILRNLRKLIHVQSECQDVFDNTVILSFLLFFFYLEVSCLVNLLIINNILRNEWFIHDGIPNSLVNRFYANFPKMIVHTTKHRRPMYKGIFCKRKLVCRHFEKQF